MAVRLSIRCPPPIQAFSSMRIHPPVPRSGVLVVDVHNLTLTTGDDGPKRSARFTIQAPIPDRRSRLVELGRVEWNKLLVSVAGANGQFTSLGHLEYNVSDSAARRIQGNGRSAYSTPFL